MKLTTSMILAVTVFAGAAILAVNAQQPATPATPEQPLAVPNAQTAPVLPKLPESQGKVLAQTQYIEDGRPALLALTFSTKNEAEATLRLRKYALRDGQPVLPAQVMSFQQSIKKITPEYWRFGGHFGQLRGDIAVVGKDTYFLLVGLSNYGMSLFVYKLDPNVQTKATVPLSRLATPDEKAEARRRIAQGIGFLPPGVTLEEELNGLHWFINPTDGDKPPLATLTKDFFHDGSLFVPQLVRFDTVTPDAVIVRVSSELDAKVNTVAWKQNSRLYRYDLKTGKWSLTQPDAAELAEFAVAADLKKRRRYMDAYRIERETFGQSKAEATARIRQRHGVKDWEPVPADWDTPDLVPKMYWLTPTPPPTVKGETVAPATK